MNNHLFAAALVLLVLPCSALGAVYKCTDADGSISYQDQPCSVDERQREIQSTKKFVVEGADLEVVNVVVPGVGLALVAIFDSMEHSTQQHGDQATTMFIRSKAGFQRMEMRITFFANEGRGDHIYHQVADQLASFSPGLKQPSMPAGSERWSFETAIGVAQMISHYSPAQGSASKEWDTITVGHVVHPRVVAAVTIFNNDKTSDGLRQALRVYNMFQVAVGNELLE